jgi:heme/copper-type cytochrome/quinol oxidase subunit 2
VLGLVSIFGTVVVGIIGSGLSSQYNIIDPEQAQESRLMSLIVNLVTIPFVVISIISTIFFIRMIRQISKWQYRKSI